MTQAMSITNFCIFIAMLYGYELFIKKRAKKNEVFFMASEERWYRILMLILAGSVLGMDLYAQHASYFVYAVLFLSYTFTYKEIGHQGIVCNMKRTALDKITGIEMKDRKHSFLVIYEVKERKYEMIVRKSLSGNLEAAVQRVKQSIK